MDSGIEDGEPGHTSATRTVPAAVPSLRQSSRPNVPSSAAKYSRPPAVASDEGRDPAPPGCISLTSDVPDPVPSDPQSSLPPVPSEAEKKTLPDTATKVS